MTAPLDLPAPDRPTCLAFGADHAGRALKDHLAAAATARGWEVLDLGAYDDASVDYPDYGAAVARAVVSGQAALGVLVCGTGIGISIAANKVPGVRAAVSHDAFTAYYSRAHNNANVLCLGARVVGPGVAESALAAFLATTFEGGRHAGRVEKIAAIEESR